MYECTLYLMQLKKGDFIFSVVNLQKETHFHVHVHVSTKRGSIQLVLQYKYEI